MTTATKALPQRPAVQRRAHLKRLWTGLLSECRRRQHKAETRRQLLCIHARLLRDVGLAGDRLLCDRRRRFRGEQAAIHPHCFPLFGVGSLNNPDTGQIDAGR